MSEGKFGHAITKMKEKTGRKTRRSTGMMDLMKVRSTLSAMEKITVCQRKDRFTHHDRDRNIDDKTCIQPPKTRDVISPGRYHQCHSNRFRGKEGHIHVQQDPTL
mmetsp:Transcript_50875/g.58820  ORF Transcript_50875/g.58820 Transcript_50875/m.58820 type:complete len:105 (-) Transcript_50875:336-650(-)